MSASEKPCHIEPFTTFIGQCFVSIGPSMSSARTYDAALPLPSVFVAKMNSLKDCLKLAIVSIRFSIFRRRFAPLGYVRLGIPVGRRVLYHKGVRR
jgi:hypothetical protein